MKEIVVKALGGLAAFALAAIHLGGAYLALACLTESRACPAPFDAFPFAGLDTRPFTTQFFVELFEQLLLIGAFLYALVLAFWSFGRRPSSVLRPIAGVFALSFAIAILLAADASVRPAAATDSPDTMSGLIYALVTQRQALLALSLIVVTAIAVATYYLIRSAFSVEYSGSGVQIRLPGHTVYYVPIYPQESWQDTGIVVSKGEKVAIELSGRVSPGALHAEVLAAWAKHMEAFVEWQCRYINNQSTLEELGKIEREQRPPTWPYTGPEGYAPECYEGKNKLPVLEKHKLYERDRFYKDDILLTVQGLPHNTVIGFIQSFGDARPKDTEKGQPAYDWEKDEDKKQLLLLSASRYPLEHQEIPRSGKLWVVINDVDIARWDNAGMFFLKLTRRSWL